MRAILIIIVIFILLVLISPFWFGMKAEDAPDIDVVTGRKENDH